MKHVLITGGAGFIGSNLANRLLSQGLRVRILDNLSRENVDRNVGWLRSVHGRRVEIRAADVRHPGEVESALDGVDQVFHFASQVAVTTSMADSRTDFEVNVLGTLNILEALRRQRNPPCLIFTSTNKVYGVLENIRLHRMGSRYVPVSPAHELGVNEAQPLNFHTPYGCSKGSADQYVLDYARHYGILAVVFRMSCIYGPHQFGTEDQGWVAHFVRSALDNRPITIYGDGAQLRDLLYIDDLLDAFLRAEARIRDLSGKAFNIGGGSNHAVSLLELLNLIQSVTGAKPSVVFEDWRPGDQRYYISDFRAFRTATGWKPTVAARQGVERLYEWIIQTQAGQAQPAMQEAR